MPQSAEARRYSDFSYRVADNSVYAQVTFSRFVEGLAPHCDGLVVLGRLDPVASVPAGYERPTSSPSPYYPSGADVAAVLRAIPAATRRFWRVLDDVDVVWILGPNPRRRRCSRSSGSCAVEGSFSASGRISPS